MKGIGNLKKTIWMPEIISALIILLFRFVTYKNAVFAQIEPDSESYIAGWGGFRDGNRMPLYPTIINLNELLFHDHYLTGVVWCQIIVSIVAVVFFYKAVKLATGNRLIACMMAVFYGCYPGIMGFDTIILSESFAISLSVFLLYFTVRYLRDSTKKTGRWMMLLVFLAVCEKTALLIYVPAVFVLLVVQFCLQKGTRKIVCQLIGIDLIMMALVFLHAGQVYMYAGTFSIDKKGPQHMLASCLQSGIYRNYPDRELVQYMEKIYLENDMEISGKVLQLISKKLGSTPKEYNPILAEINAYCIKSDPQSYIRYMFSRFIDNIPVKLKMDELTTADENTVDRFILQVQDYLIFVLRVGHIYLIGFAALFLLIKKWVQSGECPWYYLGTTGILFGIVASVFLGTYGDYNRCMIYVLPFAFFGLALLLNDLCGAIPKYKLE